MNVTVLQGRLVRDPEKRFTGSNVPVTSFTIAVDRERKDKDGNRPSDFIDCVAWRNTAEFIDKWFAKGDLILVQGTLQQRKYEDRQGNKRTAIEVLVEKVNFCGRKSVKDMNEDAYHAELVPIEADDEGLPF